MAKGSGEPIPDDPSADVFTKVGRSIARGKRRRVPIYQRTWQVFLALGILPLVIAGITFLASIASGIPHPEAPNCPTIPR
jgi:hypothetical protein